MKKNYVLDKNSPSHFNEPKTGVSRLVLRAKQKEGANGVSGGTEELPKIVGTIFGRGVRKRY